MVPVRLIEDVAAELRQMFVDTEFQLKNKEGEYQYPNVFEHDLPPPKEKGDPRQAPSLVVYLHQGGQDGPSEPTECQVHFIGTVYDDTEDLQGYKDALGLIEKVRQHLYSRTIIAGVYEAIYPYSFATMDDMKYPYFPAGLAVTFQLHGTTPQNIEGGYAV